jgi:hypothetical protein
MGGVSSRFCAALALAAFRAAADTKRGRITAGDDQQGLRQDGRRERRRNIGMLQTYEGGCHCGRIRFRIQADLAPPAIGECNCSICTKKGILHITVAPENFELLRGEGEMTTYRFNTGTAQHTFCTTCGIHAFYVPRSDVDKYSVNARCLDDFDPATMQPVRLFDGRNWEAAYAEREGRQTAGA